MKTQFRKWHDHLTTEQRVTTLSLCRPLYSRTVRLVRWISQLLLTQSHHSSTMISSSCRPLYSRTVSLVRWISQLLLTQSHHSSTMISSSCRSLYSWTVSLVPLYSWTVSLVRWISQLLLTQSHHSSTMISSSCRSLYSRTVSLVRWISQLLFTQPHHSSTMISSSCRLLYSRTVSLVFLYSWTVSLVRWISQLLLTQSHHFSTMISSSCRFLYSWTVSLVRWILQLLLSQTHHFPAYRFLIHRSILKATFSQWERSALSKYLDLHERNLLVSLYLICIHVLFYHTFSTKRNLYRIYFTADANYWALPRYLNVKFVSILVDELLIFAINFFSSRKCESRILSQSSTSSWTAKTKVIANLLVIVNSKRTSSMILNSSAYVSHYDVKSAHKPSSFMITVTRSQLVSCSREIFSISLWLDSLLSDRCWDSVKNVISDSRSHTCTIRLRFCDVRARKQCAQIENERR